MTCIAADHDSGQPFSYHHHYAIFQFVCPPPHPPPNFVVSRSITIKSGVIIEFDKFFFKIAKKSFENDATEEL